MISYYWILVAFSLGIVYILALQRITRRLEKRALDFIESAKKKNKESLHNSLHSLLGIASANEEIVILKTEHGFSLNYRGGHSADFPHNTAPGLLEYLTIQIQNKNFSRMAIVLNRE